MEGEAAAIKGHSRREAQYRLVFAEGGVVLQRREDNAKLCKRGGKFTRSRRV
jgi:hypothetical protein